MVVWGGAAGGFFLSIATPSVARAEEPTAPDLEPGVEAGAEASAEAAVALADKESSDAESADSASERGELQSGPRADEIWRAYSQRWAETEDFGAEFRQKIVVAGLGTEVESGGRFSFQKPDRVLWEYLEGPPQTVVGDGESIWVYQPDLEQVYRVDYATAFGSGGLVALLADREGLSERYRSGIEEAEDGSFVIVLVPRDETVGRIEISVTEEEFELRGVRVTDPSGSVTHMTFHDVERNAGVDEERFTFTAPKGVDIITSPLVEF